MLDNLQVSSSHPPSRPWIQLSPLDRANPTALFTVMCYNVLCDRYATRGLYGYCPQWALNWEYRKKGDESIKVVCKVLTNNVQVSWMKFVTMLQILLPCKRLKLISSTNFSCLN